MLTIDDGPGLAQTAPPSPPPQAFPASTPTQTVAPATPSTAPSQAQVNGAQTDITNDANGYRPAVPTVTAQDSVTAAVLPVVAQAQQDQIEAEHKLANDQAAANARQSECDSLSCHSDSYRISAVKRHIEALQQQLGQQHQQIATDQQQVEAAKARVAAGNVVLYSQQQQVDQAPATASNQEAATTYNAMKQTLSPEMTLQQGDVLNADQVAALNPQQQSAYVTYLSAQTAAASDQAKVNADSATVNENYAQLQLYASDPQRYGAIANNAIDAVNQALGPQGLQMQVPQPVDVNTAQQNLDGAKQAATYYDAIWDATSVAVAGLDATNKVSAPQQKVDALKQQVDDYQKQHMACPTPDTPLMQQLKQAESDLTQAQRAAEPFVVDQNIKVGYVYKLQAEQGVQAAQQKVDKAQVDNDNWRKANPQLAAPGNQDELALTEAKQDLALARQQASVANSSFIAAVGQSHVLQMDRKAAAASQNMVSGPCSANSAQQARGAWLTAKTDAAATHSAVDRISANANKQAADLQVTIAERQVTAARQTLAVAQQKAGSTQPPYVLASYTRPTDRDQTSPPGIQSANQEQADLVRAETGLALTQQGLSAAKLQQQQAQYVVDATNFALSLPSNLQDPRSDADKQELRKKQEEFDLQHMFKEGPINDKDAVKQLQFDLDHEERKINSRGWMQSSADWVNENMYGGHRSDLETYLRTDLKDLKDLEAKKAQMSATDYQAKLHRILDSYGVKYSHLQRDEEQGEEHWQTANEVARVAVATTVGVAVTACTANPLLGAAAGFGTYQAFDAGNDVKAEVSGGDVGADGHLSLVGLGIEAARRRATGGELEMAGIDVVEEGVSSLSSGFGAAAASRVSALVGSRAIPMVASRLGITGLQTAARNATAEEMAQIASQNAAKSVLVRAGSTIPAGGVNQAINGAGQMLNTAIGLEAQGQLFTATGGNALLQEGKNQAFYVATALPAAGFSGALPAHGILLQAGADLGTNFAQSEVHARVFDHRNMNEDEALAAGITTVPGTMQRLTQHPQGPVVIKSMFPWHAYTEKSYAQLYATADAKLQAILPAPGKFALDEMTARLGNEVPGGLEEIIGDFHAHYLNYARVVGKQFESLLNTLGKFARAQFVGIAEFCGGDYYANFNPSDATTKKMQELDIRVAKEFKATFKADPKKAAKVDPAANGLDVSDAGTDDPVARDRKLLLDFPAVFASIGELTGQKELISIQKGPHAWTIDSAKFGKLLEFAGETGQAVLLHYDWGAYGKNDSGGPAAVKTDYKFFDKLVGVLADPKYRNVRIVLAHTGIGRYVRPGEKPITDQVSIVDWDWVNKQAKGQPRTTMITAPQHIHKLYELFAKVPNARADISWNDVTQAYADHPELRAGLVDFVINNQDRLLFGSDTVKPENEGQYHQALNTGSPMFAAIAKRVGGPTALWKLLRQNYEDVLNRAQDDVVRWTRQELEAEERDFQAQGKSLEAQKSRDKIDEMDKMVPVLKIHRQKMLRDARKEYGKWVKKLKNQPGLPPGIKLTEGVFSALYRTLPPSPNQNSSTRQGGSRIGEFTSGGETNDSTPRQALAGLATTAAVGAAAAVDGIAVHEPASAGLVDSTMQAGATDNTFAFGVRGALSFLKTLYVNNVRREWEDIFENGNVTKRGVDSFVGRIMYAAPHLGFTPEQLTRVSAATEQFWANYTYLDQLQVDDARGWTAKQKQNAIMAKVGEYQVTVDRELGGQAASINLLDARLPWGQLHRAGTLLTYLVNDAVTASWALHGGINMSSPVAVFDTAFHTLFGLRNAGLTVRTAAELVSGLFKLNWETGTRMKGLQAGAMGALTAAGGFWTVDDAVHDLTIAHPNPVTNVEELASVVLDLFFTVGAGMATRIEFNKFAVRPMPTAGKLPRPLFILAGALIIREMLALALMMQNGGNGKQ